MKMLNKLKYYLRDGLVSKRLTSKKSHPKKKLNKSDIVLEEKVVNKMSVIMSISAWTKKYFVFHNKKVHLVTQPKELPVKNVNDELFDITEFKKTGMSGLEYLILVVLNIGIKIGREMEKYETKDINKDDNDE